MLRRRVDPADLNETCRWFLHDVLGQREPTSLLNHAREHKDMHIGRHCSDTWFRSLRSEILFDKVMPNQHFDIPMALRVSSVHHASYEAVHPTYVLVHAR